jgi:hypothetical protein
MKLPTLSTVDNLPLGLPSIKENQTWALNIDTNPPSLVLVEFVLYKQPTPPSSAQESANSLADEESSLINNQLSSLSLRISRIEDALRSITS